MRPFVVALLLLLALPGLPADDPAIAWFAGSVDDAFATAADAGKPVLLYWGAQWCPPCNQLKATVFKRPAFVEQTRAFVPVYLDGDQPGAQKWGEFFGIVGYPTLIVLRADRSELLRLSGSIDVEQFPRVLELAHRQTQGVAALLAKARAQPKSLGEDDWTLLAFHGWNVDEGRTVPRGEVGATLDALAQSCPRADLRARLSLLALIETVNGGRNPRQRLVARGADAPARLLLLEILGDDKLLRTNLVEIEGYAAPLIAAASAPGSKERAALGQALYAAMDRVAADTSQPLRARVDAGAAQLALFQADHPGAQPPKSLAQAWRALALSASSEAKTPVERQSVISAAADLLDGAGYPDEAEALLRAELEHAAEPYYYMVALSNFAGRRRDIPAALDWLRRAWDAAQGTATRTQWGIYYVRGLIDMRPDDREAIDGAASRIIGELAADPAAWYQRTRHKLGDLGRDLKRWSAAHDGAAVIRHLREKMAAVCAPLPAGGEVKGSCEAFAA